MNAVYLLSKQLERCGLTRFKIEHDSGDNNDRHKEEDDEKQANRHGVLVGVALVDGGGG